jgi:LacI family transcriptional regulator
MALPLLARQNTLVSDLFARAEKMRHQRLTIKDIAHTVGVSPQTVSRVLNGRPDVANETRRRVQEVMAQLDYQPSALARSLVHRRSYTLGVVTAGLNYNGPARTLQGIIHQSEQEGYTLLLKELVHFDAIQVKPLLDALYARQVDGIIWAVPEIGDNLTWVHTHSAGNAVPVLFLAIRPHPGHAIATVNSHRGGWLATEHLLTQGCRHIGHISGAMAWWTARERNRGWKDALHAAGLTTKQGSCVEGNWSAASGVTALRQLIESFPGMDAIFVANDQMALGVLQEAHRQGIRIPQDLAVVGYDNIPEAAYFWPPLTSVQQDQRELGAMAVKTLIRLIEPNDEEQMETTPEPVVVEPTLVIRESSRKSS